MHSTWEERRINNRVAEKAGSAFLWKAAQYGGIKIIFLFRLVILARLLAPEDFGLLAVAMVAIDVLMRLTDFGMIPALVQRSDADDRHYHAAWTIGMGRALSIAVAVFFGAPLIADVFNEPRSVGIIQVLALRPVLMAVASIKVAECTRHLQFRSLALMQLPEAVVSTLVAIVLASYLGVWALVVGTLGGLLTYCMMSYGLAPYRPRIYWNRAVARSLILYGRWIFLRGLIVMGASLVLQIVISRQLGVAELGLYFLAARLAFLPAEVASEVVGAVAFPLYARLQTNRRMALRAFHSILIAMAALVFPICLLIIVLAPALVQEVLGAKWEGTVPVIQLLALVSMIGLFGETVEPILKGLGRPDKVVVLEGIQSLILVAFVWLLTGHYGVVGAAIAWLPAVCVSQVASARFVRQALPHPFSGLKIPLLVTILATLVGGVVALGVEQMLPGLVGLITAGLAAMMTIGIMFWVSDRRFKLGWLAGLGRTFPQVATFIRYAPSGG